MCLPLGKNVISSIFEAILAILRQELELFQVYDSRERDNNFLRVIAKLIKLPTASVRCRVKQFRELVVQVLSRTVDDSVCEPLKILWRLPRSGSSLGEVYVLHYSKNCDSNKNLCFQFDFLLHLLHFFYFLTMSDVLSGDHSN